MSIKPILMNTDMVRALLDGRKTVTRRVVMSGNYTPTEIGRSKFYGFRDELNGKPGAWAGFYDDSDVFVGPDGKHHTDAIYAKLPYRPGDILYVRETWRMTDFDCIDTDWSASVQYKADMAMGERWHDLSPDERVGWRPSIHMPREAARIWLRVTGVRVERLQEIDDDCVVAEGLKIGDPFDELWDSTIKPADRERYGWAANPWVWVIEFEQCEKPEEGLNYEREKTRG